MIKSVESEGVAQAVESEGVVTSVESEGVVQAVQSEGVAQAVESEGVVTSVETQGVAQAVESEGVAQAVESEGVVTSVQSEGVVTSVETQGVDVSPVSSPESAVNELLKEMERMPSPDMLAPISPLSPSAPLSPPEVEAVIQESETAVETLLFVMESETPPLLVDTEASTAVCSTASTAVCSAAASISGDTVVEQADFEEIAQEVVHDPLPQASMHELVEGDVVGRSEAVSAGLEAEHPSTSEQVDKEVSTAVCSEADSDETLILDPEHYSPVHESQRTDVSFQFSQPGSEVLEGVDDTWMPPEEDSVPLETVMHEDEVEQHVTTPPQKTQRQEEEDRDEVISLSSGDDVSAPGSSVIIVDEASIAGSSVIAVEDEVQCVGPVPEPIMELDIDDTVQGEVQEVAQAGVQDDVQVPGEMGGRAASISPSCPKVCIQCNRE